MEHHQRRRLRDGDFNALSRLPHLFWSIVTDRRNFASISKPKARPSSVSKALAQQLETWRAFLSKNPFRIRDISGEFNVWVDTLGR